MNTLRGKLGHPSLHFRVLFGAILMMGLFLCVTTLSYYALPVGMLRNRNPLQGWDESSSVAGLTAQIFFYNLISVAVIVVASLFASRKDSSSPFLSTGYLTFYMLVIINAITLGTWSFSLGGDAPELLDRISGMFQVWRRAGLWEMTGQLIITCALAHSAIVQTTGTTTVTRSLEDARPDRTGMIAIAVGLVLMLIGAIIESIAIHA